MKFYKHRPNLPINNTRSRSKGGVGIKDLAHYWILRYLLECDGLSTCINENGFSFRNEVAAFIGVNDPMTNDTGLVNQLKTQLRSLYKRYAGKRPELPPLLKKNINELTELFQLNDQDVSILLFILTTNVVEPFETVLDAAGSIDESHAHDLIATILGFPVDQVQQSLGIHGVLIRTGIIGCDLGLGEFSSYYSFNPKSMAHRLLSYDAPVIGLFRNHVSHTAQSALSLANYPYLQEDFAVLLPLLQKALTPTGRFGCNIYIYGAPGTGKTELPRVLGAVLGVPVYEIPPLHDDGDPIDRLRSLRIAQTLFGKKPSLIVVDEVEELLEYDVRRPVFFRNASVSKSSLTKLMDDVVTPTFWISNSADIKPALARRFDLVIRMPVPPQHYRIGLLTSLNQDGMFSSQTIQQLGAMESLSPADVERVMTIMHHVKENLPPEDREKVLCRMLNHRLELQSLPMVQRISRSALPQFYDLRFLNSDTNLEQLAISLKTTNSATLCMYGPPGTGKSAFAQWLAQKLDRPLIIRRASEILNKYVGETEKRIAEIFSEAEAQQGILLLDEIDGFFQNRQTLQSSWQLNMVNEFLTRMESFNGIFIATTNLLTVLDEAFMRRFDLRIGFNYLQPDQVRCLYSALALAIGLHDTVSQDDTPLSTFNYLTPGDFAVVQRRHLLNPLPDHSALMEALQKEQAYKKDKKQHAIGFI